MENDILLIHTGGIGDMIMLRPSLFFIRQKYPDKKITLLGNAFSLQAVEHDLIDYKIVLPTGKKNFSNTIRVAKQLLLFRKKYSECYFFQPILQNSVKTKLLFLKKMISPSKSFGRHNPFGEEIFDVIASDESSQEVIRFLGVAGWKGNGIDYKQAYRLTYSNTDKTSLLNKLSNFMNINMPFLVYAIGGAKPTRIWPAHKFAELSNLVYNRDGHNHIPVFIGSQQEVSLFKSIATVVPSCSVPMFGTLSVRELMIFISLAKLVISNDTGPMHIANAVDVPQVAIFGPGDYSRIRPFIEKKCKVVKNYCPCAPCYKIECKDAFCLKNIEVQDVYGKILELIG